MTGVSHTQHYLQRNPFSLVYFTSKFVDKLSPEARTELHGHGFRVPHSRDHQHNGEDCDTLLGHKAESVRSNRKTLDAEQPMSGTSTQARRGVEGNLENSDPSLGRPGRRSRSKSPEQEVRFSRTKTVVLYGPECPPKEAIAYDTARVLPLAAHQFCRLWMLDSGASYDVIRRRDLTLAEQSSERDATIVAPLRTAAGQLSASKVVTSFVGGSQRADYSLRA